MKNIWLLFGFFVLISNQASNPALACSQSQMGGGTATVFKIRFYTERSGIAVASASGFQTGAAAGDTCAAAVAVSGSIFIESVTFVDEQGDRVAFSEFTLDRKLSKEFGRSFRVFSATALTDIVDTPSSLEIKFRPRRSDVDSPIVADMFAKGRVATAQIDAFGKVVGHAAIVNPSAAVLCLGPEEPGTSLSTCPPTPRVP